MTDVHKVLDAIVCEHIANKQRPVKLVFHNTDYSWEFMCGHDDHTDFNKAQILPLEAYIHSDIREIRQEEIKSSQIDESKTEINEFEGFETLKTSTFASAKEVEDSLRNWSLRNGFELT